MDRAIAMEPKDATFYGLKGDLLIKQKNYSSAVKEYDRAIALDDQLFAYYLGRGVANSRLNSPAAKADLERSAQLLPTAMAYHELGRLAEGGRDVDTALRYYQIAAQSESSIGAPASARLVALDLPRNPSSYIATEVGFAEGRPALSVANLTSVPLVDIAARATSMGGRTDQRRHAGGLEARAGNARSDRYRNATSSSPAQRRSRAAGPKRAGSKMTKADARSGCVIPRLAGLGQLQDERGRMFPAPAAARASTGLFAHRGRVAMPGIDGAFDVLVGDRSAEADVHLAPGLIGWLTGSDSK